MIKKCLICKREFIVYLSNLKKGYAKFCSRKCYEISRRNKPLSKEWREKISIANKGRKKPKGFAEKCRQRMLGTKMSLKIRKKLSLAHLGKTTWNKGKKCPSISKKMLGKNNHRWKGGRIFTTGKRQYILIKNRKHPFATKSGYVPEHRLIMEKYLGRFLKPEEVVHHINGNTLDNRIQNLKLFANDIEHIKFHRKSIAFNKS